MLRKAVILASAIAMLALLLSATTAFAEQKAANSVAVCGCGKVFVPNSTTEYFTYNDRQYACCSHECHLKAEADPSGAARMWNAAYTTVMSGKTNINSTSSNMTRDQVYADMKATFGEVPGFFTQMPDDELPLEWALFKHMGETQGAVPEKYRELIGIAVAGTMKCHYCAYYHTQMAKLAGATDAEIEDALHVAKDANGWSAYINGLQVDYDQFKQQVDQACAFVKMQQTAGAK
jgi:AhpD family alkylhydroperoxidase